MPVTQSFALPFRPPLLPDSLFGHLVATAVPGVEEWREGAYRFTLRLPGGPGVAALRPAAAGPGQRPAEVPATLTLTDPADAARAWRPAAASSTSTRTPRRSTRT